MTGQPHADRPKPGVEPAASEQNKTPVAGRSAAEIDCVANPPPVAEATPAPKISPEDQMALYENDLKENDWGHQPC